MSSPVIPIAISPWSEKPGVAGSAGPATRRPAAPWYARAHPVRWLRWLRTGMLTLILVAGLLCLLVAYQAHREITTATGDGVQAISEVRAAYTELFLGDKAVTLSFSTGDVALVGPGATYSDDVTAARQDLVLAAGDLAAGDNADGFDGTNTIQFAEGLLGTYGDLVQQASTDLADSNKTLAMAELGYAHVLLDDEPGDLLYVLSNLRESEQAAVTADLGSRWLRPGDFWWLLLAPFLAMLLLAAGTSYVLWHGFRRLLSVRLTSALVLTLALVALVASLTVHDGGQAKAFIDGRLASQVSLTPAQAPRATGASFAYSPWTLAAGLVLAGGAGILAFAAYWPRLDEYRYRA
jgi:hypothetical protein